MLPWLRALRKLRSARDALLAVQILAFAAAVPCLTRVRLDRLRRLLTPRTPCPSATPDSIARTIRCVDGVLALAGPIVKRSCLTRGLTLYYFLRRAGLDVALCFGVAYGKGDGAFAGHCWLVRDGEPYLEPRVPLEFTEMYRFPSGHVGNTVAREVATENLRV